MAVEILLENRGLNKIWDISKSVQTAQYTTNRTGSPGTLKMSIVKSRFFAIDNGDVVRMSYNGKLIFYGWIFASSRDRWGIVDVTCYDRLRYLKATASYAFYGATAGDVIRRIAGDFQLSTGAITDTGYQMPSLIEDAQTCLDIVGDAVEQTLLNTGRLYVFYDDGNGLALSEPTVAQVLRSSAIPSAGAEYGIMVGDKSHLTEYTWQASIDSQTYNSIKLARPNEETGRVEVFQAEDSDTINRWGLLQYYATVDGGLNDAQAKAQALSMLSYYNKPQNRLSVTVLDAPVRAGELVYFQISSVPDLVEGRFLLVERATQNYSSGVLVTELETWTWGDPL